MLVHRRVVKKADHLSLPREKDIHIEMPEQIVTDESQFVISLKIESVTPPAHRFNQ